MKEETNMQARSILWAAFAVIFRDDGFVAPLPLLFLGGLQPHTLRRKFRMASAPYSAIRGRLLGLTITLRQIVIRVAPLLCEF